MRIVFVLSYPAYYTVKSLDEWLAWGNRDRRMPAILAEMGVDVELWGVGREAGAYPSDAAFGTPYTVRLFPAANPKAKERNHYSDAMVAAARADDADLFVVIGTNGGAGYRLFDKALRLDQRRFALIIGGDYWSRLVPHAALVLTESQVQEDALAKPGRRFWRRTIPRARMLRLPKTIDTDRFRPVAAPYRYDIVAVSRLTRWKSFDAVGALSTEHRVAVAGAGPDAEALKTRYPEIDWLGHVQHAEIPALLASSGLYFHAGRRDYFPRAIAEAMACGKPVVAFEGRVGADVVPADCGLLVTDRDYRPFVAALLGDPQRMDEMGRAARSHVVATHGLRSSEAACRALIDVVEAGR